MATQPAMSLSNGFSKPVIELQLNGLGVKLIAFQSPAAAAGGIGVAGRGMPHAQYNPLAGRRLPYQLSIRIYPVGYIHQLIHGHAKRIRQLRCRGTRADTPYFAGLALVLVNTGRR